MINITNVPKEGKTYATVYSFSDSDYSRNVTVTSNVGWITASVDASTRTITIVVAQNSSTSTRDGSVTPMVNNNACNSSTIYVSQEGAEEPPTPPGDLGEYMYSVGLLSDLHIRKADDEWWDEADFERAMNLFVADSNIKFIASCGDIAQSDTNEYAKHPESTSDADYDDFIQHYDVPYWQTYGMRFFSPLGNHDFYGMFETRTGDTITGKKNSETTLGYNSSVQGRLSTWISGQGVNSIPANGRNRMFFDLEKGYTEYTGQADMNFFAYNGYVDLYAQAAGYTGSIWDANKGGISDEAIRVTKNYVNNNWNSCKNKLSGWESGSLHGRNGYSKMNYWLKKDNNVYVFLSVDYGDDTWPVTNTWHDRVINARTIINTSSDDPFIKRMVEYVSDTSYSNADRAYDYQYYSPNTLIWLREVLEGNKNNKVFIFSHHFMTNRVGNGTGIPSDGCWYYSNHVYPDGTIDDRTDSQQCGGYNKGSNSLTGIEFWFIDKLMKTYKNTVWFTGHSHISFGSGANFDNHYYPIVSPSTRNGYVYTKSSNNPSGESAWCVALPSMAKPKDIVNCQGETKPKDAEMGIMEVYQNGVKIKGYKIKENNQDVFNLLSEQTMILI